MAVTSCKADGLLSPEWLFLYPKINPKNGCWSLAHFHRNTGSVCSGICREMESVAKRAILYKKRALSLDSKMGETIAGPQYHISLNSGGGSKAGAGDVQLNESFQRVQEITKPILKKDIFGRTKPFYPEVPVNEAEAVTGERILNWARSRLSKDDAANANASNVIMQQGADGKIRVRYKKMDDKGKTEGYVNLNFVSEYDLNPTAQPGVKGKNKAVIQANENQQKKPSQPAPVADRWKKYIRGTAKGNNF